MTPAGPVQWAQLTPTGSGCSIQLANLADGPPMPPGSQRGLQLVVSDVEAAREHLLENGVAAGTINVIDDRDGGTMFDFADPDGNAWVVQQIKAQGGGASTAALSWVSGTAPSGGCRQHARATTSHHAGHQRDAERRDDDLHQQLEPVDAVGDGRDAERACDDGPDERRHDADQNGDEHADGLLAGQDEAAEYADDDADRELR